MPRDIRSYFSAASTTKTQSHNATKQKKRRIISSDEDDVKIQSPIKRSKKTKKVDKHAISSDSEDEKQKTVSPADILGKKPINRQAAPKITKQVQKKEAKAHDDDDFEATLIQLDTSEIEQNYFKESKSNEDDKLKKDDKHETKAHNKIKNRTPTKNKSEEKEEVKKTPEKIKTPKKPFSDSKKQDEHNRKRSASSSNEEKEEKDRKRRKEKHGIAKKDSKVDVEYAESKKKKSPEKPDIFEERLEKKKQGAALYQQYLQRGGARNPGSKEIPVGADYCLAGLSFLVTGVLDCLEREEADALIQKYGGRILHQISRNTNYVVVGDQPGPAKISKANSLNVKQITEDELLEMIRTRPAGNPSNIKQSHSKSKDRQKQKSIEEDTFVSPPKILKPSAKQATELPKQSSPIKTESVAETKEISVAAHQEKEMKPPKTERHPPQNENVKTETQALVEKYRPKSMKQILGQQGDKSNAKKLHHWLLNWHKNRSGQVKHTKPSPWAKNDDGSFFKAALLSGPPGIGKTTTVQVVCNELGFDLVEFNASDTRSKRLLQEEVSELLRNTTLKDYFTDSSKKPSSKHALLMDEVDGMAGNEDRGGLQELIALIKSSEIPIVCICNDRNNPKMRTLANYTFDLRFQKPRLEQIRGAMKSICFKEHINISTEDLDRLIESTNQDIRQVINHLALFAGNTACQEKTEKKHINKDLKLGPWEVVKKVFSAEEHKHMSIHDKSGLFFHDYSIAPLFVQENYLLVVPQAPKNQLLERVAQCAESLALGDVVEKSIRSAGAWSLLPMQACYSSVIPGSVMSGHISGQINFPAWLGRNSRANKFDRLRQEITVHARLATGASKEAINLDYLDYLRDSITRPLAIDGAEGVEASMNVMNNYHLLREDLDSLVEISLWPGQKDPMQAIDSKVKAAFTRTYNKHSAAVPYAMNATSKKKSAQPSQDEGFIDDEEENEVNSDEDENNVELDKMIKAKKPTASKKTESKTSKPEKADKPSKRGRGRGKAK